MKADEKAAEHLSEEVIEIAGVGTVTAISDTKRKRTPKKRPIGFVAPEVKKKPRTRKKKDNDPVPDDRT
jgi:hypothetical protein